MLVVIMCALASATITAPGAASRLATVAGCAATITDAGLLSPVLEGGFGGWRVALGKLEHNPMGGRGSTHRHVVGS
jgi:hypothetical protein